MVEAQDGRIWARPAAEGAGAEFIVSFPAAQDAEASPPRPADSGQGFDDERNCYGCGYIREDDGHGRHG